MSSYADTRQAVYQTVMEAVALNLIRASAGNVSVRTEDGHVAITPATIKYKDLKPEQIAIVDLNGVHIDGPNRSSSETPMHTSILRNCPHINAICHTHSVYGMTFAVLGEEIPMVNLELYTIGAPIPVAPWACPGSAAGGEVTVDIFNARPDLKAMLLRNHGVVAVGETLGQALSAALDLETGAQVYFQARQLGKPKKITAKQQREVDSVYKPKK